MKKSIIIALAVALISCNKEELDNNNSGNGSGNTSEPIPSTIELIKNSFVYQLEYCRFSYTDVDGNIHENETHMDRTIENVDFSKPLYVFASSGLTTYNGSIPTFYAQLCEYQLKRDGNVIDVQTAVHYAYSNQ